ncbi:zinc finger CCCH domain-containing protein [Trifolium repens]|nr:zinc finger CCCH domain-containing protein [Trifolium repens]
MRDKEERGGVERGRSLRRNLHGISSHQGRRLSAKGKGFVHHLDRITTSFFFTNFPVEVKTMELWGLFNKFGKVGEVYIPNKLDKKGHRFGFVKFKEVTNAKALESRLDNVWWESYKLRINLSRFNRGAKEASYPSIQSGGEKTLNTMKGVGQHEVTLVEKGRSFKNALTMEGCKGNVVSGVSGDILPVQSQCLEVRVNDDLLKQLQASFVGFLVEERDIVKVNEGLVMEGYNWITATSMGGNMVWLRCRGVPLHAWDESLFRQIADRFGSFIEVDPYTANRSKLDIPRVKISLSKMESIDSVISILVMGKTYQVWVVEEGECEVVGCDRGGRHVGEWVLTASSVASAVEREAIVIGEDLSDGGGDNGDAAFDGAEEVDLVGEGRKGLFDDTRKGVDNSTEVSENFLGHLGNTQVLGDQVETMAISSRKPCDGIPSQQDLGGFLENGPDGDKWQRAERPQEVLGVGFLVDQAVVDPIATLNSNLVVEGERVISEEKELGPISVGPNSFGPLSDLNPEVEVGEAVCRGVILRPVVMGLPKSVQQSGVKNEAIGGLVIQVQANVSVPNLCGVDANVMEQ